MAATKYLDYNGLLYFWTLLKAKFANKVDKVTGKGLSTNDFTDAYKTKLDGIDTGAEVNVIETVKVNGTALTVTSKAVDVPVPTATTTSPKMNGTAAVGSETKWAQGDHVHPSDTTKVDKVTGKGLSTNDFTDALETKLEGVAAGAQVNVIEGVKVNSTALTPSSKVVSIPNASTSAYGCTKLTSATNSTSEALAATAKAVKTAYDLANGKQSPATTLAGYGITDAYTKSEIDTKLTSAMHYKGSVTTAADLPSSNNATGDFYNVTATGENYAWDGSAWDVMGSVVDLQNITNEEIDTIVAS